MLTPVAAKAPEFLLDGLDIKQQTRLLPRLLFLHN